MPPRSGQRYNISCFQIAAKSTRVCVETKSGVFPASMSGYKIVNIGRTEIYAQAIYGTAFSWIGTIVAQTLKPGDEKDLDVGLRMYYEVGVKIENKGDIRALAHIGSPDGWAWYDTIGPGFQLNIDINEVAKQLVSFGVSKIPYVGPVLSALTDFFWPDNKPSVWSQIKDQVENLIDSKTNDAIQALLSRKVAYVKERIFALERDLKDEKSRKDSAGHYMNIAEDLIGFETMFSFGQEDHPNYVNINYIVLSMYSNIITLKLKFHQFGINNQTKVGLTDDNIYRIKTYSKRLLFDKNGAINYIKRVEHDSVEEAYKTCDPDNVYDAVATARTYVGLNGTEFIEFWKAILEHPESETKPYCPVIIYSTHFCRPTPWQARQIVPEEVPEPLQPKLIDGKRNRIGGIDVWMWRIRPYAAQKISGIKIYWEHGDSSSLGKWSSEKNYIDFKGAYLTKLTAWGDGALDCLQFELSDGRSESYGTTSDSYGLHQVFELENHHIAGLYLTGGQKSLAGQACTISVSYQLTPTS